MASKSGFAPDKIEVVPKGARMYALYASTGGSEPEFVCSFFNEEKVNYVVNALKETHGVKVVRKKGDAAVKEVKSKPAAKTASVKKRPARLKK